MKSSEALKGARRLIQAQETVYVCHALIVAGGGHTAVYSNLHSMFGEASITSWLREHSQDYRQWREAHLRESRRTAGCVVGYVPRNPDFTRTMRQYRLAWIDWMIEGYEAVGD